MTNVAEFIEARQQIETLINQIAVSAERKPRAESTQRLDEVAGFLETLKTMADNDNDVQVRVILRLTSELNALGKKVAKVKVAKVKVAKVAKVKVAKVAKVKATLKKEPTP